MIEYRGVSCFASKAHWVAVTDLGKHLEPLRARDFAGSL